MLTYDVNIFYKEQYNEETEETWWEDVFTMYPSVYEDDTQQHMFDCAEWATKCTAEETKVLAEHFSLEEYGTDFFMFLSTLLDYDWLPQGIRNHFEAMPDPREVKPS